MTLPKRKLGKTGVDVTILGLGGEGILRTFGHEREASTLINRAIDLGINYFESARAYSGSEAYYGSALRERRKDIFLASKSHARDRKGALAHLHETLANMKTDHLDLWQVHDVREEAEVEEIFGSGGAIEAFSEAREKGMARFIGVTGHHNPLITRKCMELFDFDTVLIPINPAEHVYSSFIKTVIPAARERKMGIVAMKTYFRGLAAQLPGFQDLEPFYRFTLSHPISTAVIGCDSIEQLEENVRFAAAFEAMTKDEMDGMQEMITPYARKLMYYKP
ncbi:MAG: aldo/keto reductase [Thermodesulfovibrio sp.]|nr:aldo/keto reductase [Thermodesulfovibrio sp.]